MEIDIGASVSLFNSDTYRKYFHSKDLESSGISLNKYTWEQSKILGSLKVEVHYKEIMK